MLSPDNLMQNLSSLPLKGVLLSALLIGCGADNRACTPGAAVGCTCSDSHLAHQVCNSAGTALGQCACDADAGAPTDAIVPPDAQAPMDASIDRVVVDAPDVGVDSAAAEISATDVGINTAPDDVPPIDVAPADVGADVRPADIAPLDAAPTDIGHAADVPSSCPAGMALIPAGMFLMGDAASDDMPSQPLHGVRLSTYCMDLTEVTLAAYGDCAAAGCTAPNTGGHCNRGVAGRDDHPVNCVDWNQARAYCQSRGGDLPTEAQWEYAARGTDGRTFPWGNDAPSTQLCWSTADVTRTSTCAVRSFPAGNSPFGLFDMAGNVWEWTLDWYGSYSGDASSYVMNPTGVASGTSHINRGGSWGNNLPIDVRPMIRFGGMPTRRLESLGFRCTHGVL